MGFVRPKQKQRINISRRKDADGGVTDEICRSKLRAAAINVKSHIHARLSVHPLTAVCSFHMWHKIYSDIIK